MSDQMGGLIRMLGRALAEILVSAVLTSPNDHAAAQAQVHESVVGITLPSRLRAINFCETWLARKTVLKTILSGSALQRQIMPCPNGEGLPAADIELVRRVQKPDDRNNPRKRVGAVNEGSCTARV
jgi:hypothetical protein